MNNIKYLLLSLFIVLFTSAFFLYANQSFLFGRDSVNFSSVLGVFIRSSIELSLMFILLSLFRNRWIRAGISILFALILTLVLSFELKYGGLSHGIVASVIDSTVKESYEYVFSVNLGVEVLFFIFLFILMLSISSIKSNFVYFFYIPLLISSLLVLSFYHSKKERDDGGEKEPLFAYSSNILSFANTIKETFEYIESEKVPIVNKWCEVKVSDENVNYVVIIGESVQQKTFKDEVVSPAFSEITQHWLSYTNVISPSNLTRFSVPRILSVNNNDNVNKSLNIIDLAGMANLTTHWFSNQSQTGVHDSPIAQLSRKADHVIYHSFDFSFAGYDSILLDDLKLALTKNSGNNMFFLHMMGSHPDFCNRVEYDEAHPNYINRNQKLCYKDSVRSLIYFIDATSNILSHYDTPYKIVYLSDHGLTDINDSPYKTHGTKNKFSRDAVHVPFVFVDSSIERGNIEYDDRLYFLRDFPHTFASWIGVTSANTMPSLSIEKCDSCQVPYVYDGITKRQLN